MIILQQRYPHCEGAVYAIRLPSDYRSHLSELQFLRSHRRFPRSTQLGLASVKRPPKISQKYTIAASECEKASRLHQVWIYALFICRFSCGFQSKSLSHISLLPHGLYPTVTSKSHTTNQKYQVGLASYSNPHFTSNPTQTHRTLRSNFLIEIPRASLHKSHSLIIIQCFKFNDL